MSAVEVEISGTDDSDPVGGRAGAAEAPPPGDDDASGPDATGPEPSSGAESPPPDSDRRQRRGRSREPEVEVEREVTKRQLIESITTVLVVVLYMVFTLVRERESGVIVIDPDERDDWDE